MAGGAADGGGLRLALTGDLIHTRRLAPLVETDDGLAAIVRLLRGADAAFGNLEIAIADRDDPDAWVWSVHEDWTIAGEPHAIEDLRALGFSLVGRANNHAMDRGPAGMRTTGRLLDAAGVVHAGAGEDLARARAPRFLETPRGRVALVSATTSPSPVDVAPALDAFAGLPSRPGVHAIRLRASVTVPPEAHAALRAVHDQMSDAAGEWMLGEEDLRLFRTRFTEGAEVAIAYEAVDEDVAAAMRAVRQGRQQADAAVFAVHAHEGDRDPARPMPHLRGPRARRDRRRGRCGRDQRTARGVPRRGVRRAPDPLRPRELRVERCRRAAVARFLGAHAARRWATARPTRHTQPRRSSSLC